MKKLLSAIRTLLGIDYYRSLSFTTTDGERQLSALCFMFAAFVCFIALSVQFSIDGDTLKLNIPILAFCYFVACTCRAEKGAGTSLMPVNYKKRTLWALLSPVLWYFVIAVVLLIIIIMVVLIFYAVCAIAFRGTALMQEFKFVYDADYTSNIGAYGKIYEFFISVYYSAALIFFSYFKSKNRRWLALLGSLAVGEAVNIVLANAANGFQKFVLVTNLASDIDNMGYPIIAVTVVIALAVISFAVATVFAVNREKPRRF